MSRRITRSRSRSPSRKRDTTRSRKDSRRKERSSKRTREDSHERSSQWKTRSSRRGGSDAREKSIVTKKAREEKEFLTVGPDSHVFSMLDLIFVVGKHLVALREGSLLPLDVYELRRSMASYFEGPHKLRFNTVCNINALCAILKYFHLGKSTELVKDNEKLATDQKDKQSDKKGESEADSTTETDEVTDSHVYVDIDENSDAGNTSAHNDATTDKDDISTPLSTYLQSIAEVADQSFRELEVQTPLINIDIKDGILFVQDVKSMQMKRLLFKNRRKQRVFDLRDALMIDTVLEAQSSVGDGYQDLRTDSQQSSVVDGEKPSKSGPQRDSHASVTSDIDGSAIDASSNVDTTVQDDLGRELVLPKGNQRRKFDAESYDMDGLYKVIYQNTALELAFVSQFQQKDQSGFREVCQFGNRADCRMKNPMAFACKKVHFKRIILPNTLVQLGDCSYLDTCRHIETCRFVHYQVESDTIPRASIDMVSKGQWICCDVRKLDFSIFNPYVSVVMADPPWDIHMDLPYGTMKDSEMRHLQVQNIHNEGLLFLWVTGRTLEVGRECMELWGYRQLDELVWVKTNQLQRIIRTGRTGHWINHSKEHCLIGIKGNPVINRFVDCDVVVSEVRETSRKPDEIYGLIERVAPGALKLEIFGRSHNVRNNWITLGNQLDGYKLTHPEIKRRYEDFLAKSEANAATTTGETPMVQQDAAA
ncbi:methyltransferase MTA70 [Babesia ovis]|uniref:Methyltransferase MTA70 n=1 Tax=Babesia ovis TaxID=5869 RepID=A0A9W5TAD1_BABOV|nr:methyltransferase MTA70 [Babesia ovis]